MGKTPLSHEERFTEPDLPGFDELSPQKRWELAQKILFLMERDFLLSRGQPCLLRHLLMRWAPLDPWFRVMAEQEDDLGLEEIYHRTVLQSRRLRVWHERSRNWLATHGFDPHWLPKPKIQGRK